MSVMVPIKHTVCGGQIAWYLRGEPRPDDRLLSQDYMRLDGTRPYHGDLFNEVCPSCGKAGIGLTELERDFSDPHPLQYNTGNPSHENT